MSRADSRRAGFEAILFDLDGTLIDSLGAIRDSFEHALKVHGFPRPSQASWLAGLGIPLVEQFRRETGDEALVRALVDSYRAHNAAHQAASVRAFDGVRPALLHLAGRGARLGVVTSKLSWSAARGIAHCGLEGLFEVVVAADDVARPKPAADPVLAACARLGVAPERALMIGDTPHDLASGRAAGAATGAVLWGMLGRAELGPAAPDLWFESPAEFAALPVLGA